jgi:predicted phage terminase large subunit-like protein
MRSSEAAIQILLAEQERRAETKRTDWPANARPEQILPGGDWRTWLIIAGRGWGKTRTGAETVREWVKRGYKRIAMIAPTAADARDVLVEGESGLIAIYPRAERPIYEPSKRRITFANGALATVYSADEPDRLRGPQHDAAWCDELAAWRRPDETWSNLLMGLRLGSAPQIIVTTTPRPIPIIKNLIATPTTVITRGRTADNASNIAPGFIDELMARYGNTRLGRQELEAEVLEDVVGAFWNVDLIDRTRVVEAPEMERIVVAIDPATTAGEKSDFTAMVVAGRGREDKHLYVIAAEAHRESPEGWASRAWRLYETFGAGRVIAEQNQGGEMIRSVLQQNRPNGPIKIVASTRGKAVRAEPVAHLYEIGRVHHIGTHKTIEDQMIGFPVSSDHDDIVDALSIAINEIEGRSALPIAIGRGRR